MLQSMPTYPTIVLLSQLERIDFTGVVSTIAAKKDLYFSINENKTNTQLLRI